MRFATDSFDGVSANKCLIFRYNLNFRWILGPVLLSWILALLIPSSLRDRKLPHLEGEKFRFRLLSGRLVRLVNGKPQIVSAKQEDAEWQNYLSNLEESNLVPPPSSPKIIIVTEKGALEQNPLLVNKMSK